jgi:hypothetical protein
MLAPGKTPARKVAQLAGSEEAGAMFRHRAKRSDLLTCPLCDSRAMGGLDAEDEEDDRVRVTARCGECGTWRGAILDDEQARALAHRLARMLKRDREQLEDELRRVRLAGIDLL